MGRMKYIDYKYKIEFKKFKYDEFDLYFNNKSSEWTVYVYNLDSLILLLTYSND